jgi:hypothetical protein
VVLKHPIRSRVVRLQVIGVRGPIGKAEFLRYLGAVAIAEIRVPDLHPPAPQRNGVFATRCGELSVRAAGFVQPAVAYGSLPALDQGEPLRLRACGRHLTLPLPAGANDVYAPAGAVMQPDHLALDSPAPAPLAPPAPPQLRSAGRAAQGSQNGIRPVVVGPSWLVLGESYSSGWRAWCRDASGHERALGGSIPIDGYANGWRIDSTCVSARIAFASQGTADLAYVLSAVGTALLLAIALGARLPARIRHLRPARPRRHGGSTPLPEISATPPGGQPHRLFDRPPIQLAPGWALAWGIGVGAVASFVFEPRVGIAAGELTAFLLLVGMSPRRLTWLALLGMVAIPLLYLARPAHNYGGFSFSFSQHQMPAHWIGTGVVFALLAAAFLQSRELRAVRKSRTAKPQGSREPPGNRVSEGVSPRVGSDV